LPRILSPSYSNFAEKNFPCCHIKRVIDGHKKLEGKHSSFDLENGLIAKSLGVTDKKRNDVSEVNKSVKPKSIDIMDEEKHDEGYRDFQEDRARFSYRFGRVDEKHRFLTTIQTNLAPKHCPRQFSCRCAGKIPGANSSVSPLERVF